MSYALSCLAVLAALAVAGYLAACAGAQRWLTLREWWGPTQPTKEGESR